jgi:hypothetical protein
MIEQFKVEFNLTDLQLNYTQEYLPVAQEYNDIIINMRTYAMPRKMNYTYL